MSGDPGCRNCEYHLDVGDEFSLMCRYKRGDEQRPSLQLDVFWNCEHFTPKESPKCETK